MQCRLVSESQQSCLSLWSAGIAAVGGFVRGAAALVLSASPGRAGQAVHLFSGVAGAVVFHRASFCQVTEMQESQDQEFKVSV